MVISHFIRKPKDFLETLSSQFLPGSHWPHWIVRLVKGNHITMTRLHRSQPSLGDILRLKRSPIWTEQSRVFMWNVRGAWIFMWNVRGAWTGSSAYLFLCAHNFHTLYHSDFSAWLFALGICKFVETNYILIFMDLVSRTVPSPKQS